MVIVSLKVKHVSLKFKFYIFYFLVFLWTFFLVEFITFIVATCAVIVVFPIAFAEPAKLIATEFARHVIATLILFNWPIALWIWASFRVCDNPVNIFRLTWIFNFPFFEHITTRWLVLFFTATEAEWVSADAIYHRANFICDFLGSILTFVVGAPSDRSIIISEWLAMPFKILF